MITKNLFKNKINVKKVGINVSQRDDWKEEKERFLCVFNQNMVNFTTHIVLFSMMKAKKRRNHKNFSFFSSNNSLC
jgi:hypothetical protein